MQLIRSIYWEAKRDIIETYRYRFGVTTDIIVFTVLLFAFLMSDSGSSLKNTYNYSDYKQLLIVGYITWMYAISAISDVSSSISYDLERGVFYKKCFAKYPLFVQMFGKLISAIIVQTLITGFVTIFCCITCKISIKVNLVSLISIFLSTLGMYGIGLVLSGLVIYYKHTGSIMFIIKFGLLFITDTVSNNTAISAYTKILPLTECNKIIRLQISNQSYLHELLALCIISTFWVVVGIICSQFFIKSAKKKGILLFY